jgi:hypothetical protein
MSAVMTRIVANSPNDHKARPASPKLAHQCCATIVRISTDQINGGA